MRTLLACVKEHPEALAIGLLVLALLGWNPAVSRAPELSILTHPLIEGKAGALVVQPVVLRLPDNCSDASALAERLQRMSRSIEERQRRLWERLDQKFELLQERLEEDRSGSLGRPRARPMAPLRLSLRAE